MMRREDPYHGQRPGISPQLLGLALSSLSGAFSGGCIAAVFTVGAHMPLDRAVRRG